MTPVPSGPNPAPLGQGSRYYGHRVLIASLFLPDTITFHEVDASVIDSPRGQAAAPPSPPTDQQDFLSVDELGSRLAGVNAAFRDHQKDADPPITRTDGADPPPLVASPTQFPPSRGSAATASQPHRVSSQTDGTSSSHAGSASSSASKSQINMTKLMAEATRRPSNPQQSASFEGSGNQGSSRRPDLVSGPGRPSALREENPTPSSSVADHGRGGGDASVGGGAGSGASASNGRPRLVRGATSHSGSGQSSLGIPSSRRRGSSSTAEEAKGTAAASVGFLSVQERPSSSPNKKMNDPAGSRTPGAAAAGKAGTMQPLSIIGDLQVSFAWCFDYSLDN
jgi:trehalose 6-phosphate synthase/phosphatase